MTAELRARCEAIRAEYPDAQSALIPILHTLQDAYGHLTDEAVDEAGELMGMTRAAVEGVVSFYTLFKRHPKGKFHIQICDNLSCCMMGSGDIVKHLEERWGIREGEVTDDGLFSVERVECLAACGYAPAGQVNLRYYYRLTPEKIDELIAGLRQGEVASGERV